MSDGRLRVVFPGVWAAAPLCGLPAVVASPAVRPDCPADVRGSLTMRSGELPLRSGRGPNSSVDFATPPVLPTERVGYMPSGSIVSRTPEAFRAVRNSKRSANVSACLVSPVRTVLPTEFLGP